MSQQNTKTKNSGLAIAGFVLVIIALLLSAVPIINNFAFILAILGLVFGAIAISKAKKSGAKSGLAIAAVVLSIISGIIVISSQAMYSKVLDDTGKEIQKSLDKSSGNATEDLLKNDVEVTLGNFEANADEYGIVTTALPVDIKNKNAESKSYTIQIEVVDASGSRIADDTVYASNLGAGQSQSVKAFQFVASDKLESVKAGTFKVKTVSQF